MNPPMLASSRMRRARAACPRRGPALLVLVAIVAISGCEPSDPLAAVRLQQARGDFEGSLEPLRELLVERRDDSEILYRYGLALRVTGRPSQLKL